MAGNEEDDDLCDLNVAADEAERFRAVFRTDSKRSRMRIFRFSSGCQSIQSLQINEKQKVKYEKNKYCNRAYKSILQNINRFSFQNIKDITEISIASENDDFTLFLGVFLPKKEYKIRSK